ncbi:hypothetical protein M3Y94_00312300 [Aphelenchoides besseyi]|nr:hypothetical protein M3Y94_00312300 [Aphelenchoides besseyi]
MNPLYMLSCLLLLSTVISAQRAIGNAKGAPEMLDPVIGYGSTDSEMLNKIQGQLLSALEMLQNVQDPAASVPLKLAEKRRNKFEFIRFGRRRR